MLPRKSALAAALAALCMSTACYHAVVETGRPAGSTVVQKPWVATWIFGLVPAKPIDVSAECPGGIAKVETQQTFVNGLVGLVTIGIFTPQSATITCAAGRSGSLNLTGEYVIAAANDTPEAREAAIRAAAEESLRTRTAVFVKF
jgi:hypothetical protein